MEVRFSVIETQWGRFLAGWVPAGLVSLHFPGHHPQVPLSPPDGPARELERELNEYLEGERRSFTLPLVLRGTPFQLRVWGALLSIPYGMTVTYGEVAARIGSPRAVRAVGRAVGANPIPILVPCHRVLPKHGGLGNFGPGPQWKERLLRLEGAI
ncbi:methylated-DNA--[protein]-cysteine S-methyltransferase [Candidatus Bipolaricaulota sp. J31]